jgi:hypothetical protein
MDMADLVSASILVYCVGASRRGCATWCFAVPAPSAAVIELPKTAEAVKRRKTVREPVAPSAFGMANTLAGLPEEIR